METFISAVNPFTHQKIGAVPPTNPQVLTELFREATQAQKQWQSTPISFRRKVFMDFRDQILERKREIAERISVSTSKPYVEALSAEVFGALETLRWCVDSAPKHLKTRPLWMGRYWTMLRQSTVQRKPYGVIGIISPWNFPFGIPMGQVLPALMAGNAVILKPSELTPLVGMLIQDLFAQSSFPKGLVHVLCGGKEVGQALINSGVQKVLFTGSTAVGTDVAAAAAKICVPCSLELGGKDAMVVCADANLERAVRGALWGAFSNCGQVCASVERVLVHESLKEPFIKLLKEKVARLQIGPPQSFADMGTVISDNQKRKVLTAIENAVKDGATVFQAHNSPEIRPTLLENVHPAMTIAQDEVFGPVLPIMSFTSDDEAVDIVNASHYGLSASVWSESLTHASRIAQRLEVGSVTVNGSAYTHALPMTPWGGIKRSGWGSSHGKWGLEEVTRLHHIHYNLERGNRREFWWFGYTQDAYETLMDLVSTFTRPGKWAWVASIFSYLSMRRAKKY